jgi:hypothetical protein
MLDIEKLMREGKSLEEIGKMVTDEMNAAQTKIDAEKEAARIAAEKKAEAKKASKRKADAREAVVAAFSTYLTLVLGEEIHEDIIRTAIVDLEQSIDTIKNLKVSVNGNEFKSMLDLIF